jgi:hypothetical protein
MYFNNECAESVFNVKLNKFLRTDGFLMEIFTTFDQFIKFTADVINICYKINNGKMKTNKQFAYFRL